VPELPDVEGARRLVEEHGRGARILAVDVPHQSVLRGVALPALRRALRGRHIEVARRHGKWLIVDTDGPALVVHLGMTGQLQWLLAGAAFPPIVRATITTDHGGLVLVDRRKLARVSLVRSAADLQDALGDLGPDALGLACQDLLGRLGGTRKGLKAALMDQAIIAGLGNMLSDEVLWRARLHPKQPAAGLSPAEGRRLSRAMQGALRSSVRAGHIPRGPTWLSSQRGVDEPTCPRCDTPLRHTRVQGRTAIWCPQCQPEP
jgi:formamidopyrimidine-DNA glycosylase